MWHLLLLFTQLALLVVPVQGDHGDRRAFFLDATHASKPVDHPIVQDAAQFAVAELQKLSDSGIYKTLQLAQIHSAAAEVGDFHYSVHLRVALASPHFQSGNATEDFELLVLESKDLPGRKRHERSIAIDEFPVMDDDAIESFWIQMVEERRRLRTTLFDAWRREAEMGIDPVIAAVSETVMEVQGIPPRKKTAASARSEPQQENSPSKKKTKRTLTLEDLEAMPTTQLRKLLAGSAASTTEPLREAIAVIIDERLDRLEQQERNQAKDEL